MKTVRLVKIVSQQKIVSLQKIVNPVKIMHVHQWSSRDGKCADTANISVLFLFGRVNILAVYVRRAYCNLLIMALGLY